MGFSTNFRGISSISLPYGFIENLNVSYIGNNEIRISPGVCRDSNNVMDIYLNNNLIINALKNGPNGIADNDVFLANKMYTVLIIADSSGKNPVAGLIKDQISLKSLVLPYGYDSYRLIAYLPTGGIPAFYSFDIYGDYNERTFYYKNPVTLLQDGNALTLTPVSMTNLIPYFEDIETELNCSIFAYNTNSNITIVSNDSFFGNIVYAQNAAITAQQKIKVLVLNNGLNQQIFYSVDNLEDKGNISISSFICYV